MKKKCFGRDWWRVCVKGGIMVVVGVVVEGKMRKKVMASFGLAQSGWWDVSFSSEKTNKMMENRVET
jgi:hypothetical protein